jgi:opacity protein-like surface antigen
MQIIAEKIFRPPAVLLAVSFWLSFFSLPAITGIKETQQSKFFIGLTAGYFYPLQGTFRKIYDKPLWPVELQLCWALNRKMTVFGAARYLETSGNTVLLGEQRPEETYALRWRMATLRLGMNYRLGAARFAPFLGAGVNYSFYQEQWQGAPLAIEDKKAGFFIQAGGRYRLSRRWHALAQLEYSAVPAGSGVQGQVNLGGLNLSLGLLAGIF